MKKIACILLLLMLFGTTAFAADNQSAAWVRSMCREAATDSIDAAYFNPAGTAFLEKGFHIQAMNLSVIQEYSHKAFPSGTLYEADTPVWFFPTARMGYNGGSWAVFFDFNIPAGGGSLDYAEGAALFEGLGMTGAFKGSSSVMAFNLGGAYRFGDMISIGASGRLLYGNDGIDLTIDPPAPIAGSAEAKATGIGFGGMISVDFIPFAGFTLGVTVETGSKLEMEYTSVTGDAATVIGIAGAPLFIAEGNKYDADLPWRIRAGVAYEMPFGLTVSSTFKYDFHKAVDDTLRNTYTIAGSLAYDISDRIEVSVGGSYGIGEIPTADDHDAQDALNPELDSFTLAGGAGIEVIEGLVIDIGSLYVFYQDASASGLGGFTDMSKKVLLFGIGATYSF
jgi:long-chain fatty acid transport protein